MVSNKIIDREGAVKSNASAEREAKGFRRIKVPIWFGPLFAAICFALWLPIPVIQARIVRFGGYSAELTGAMTGLSYGLHLTHGLWAAGLLVFGVYRFALRFLICVAWLGAVALTSLWSSHWSVPSLYQEVLSLTASACWLAFLAMTLVMSLLRHVFQVRLAHTYMNRSDPEWIYESKITGTFSIVSLMCLTAVIAFLAKGANLYVQKGLNMFPFHLQILLACLMSLGIPIFGMMVTTSILKRRWGLPIIVIVAPIFAMLLFSGWIFIVGRSSTPFLSVMFLTLLVTVYFSGILLGYLLRRARFELRRLE